MKLLMMFIFTFNFAIAGLTKEEVTYNKSKEVVETILTESVGNQNTCLDEYIQREQQLRKWLIWAPPLGIVVTPVLTITGAASAAAIANIVGVEGWAGLGYVIGGGMLGLGIGALGTIGITTVSAVKFFNNRNILYLIVESHQDELEKTKKLSKFLRKYNKAWPSDQMDIRTFANAIKDYDERGVLCDGSLRGNGPNSKLKHRVARKWDLFNQIHLDYGAR